MKTKTMIIRNLVLKSKKQKKKADKGEESCWDEEEGVAEWKEEERRFKKRF